MQFVNLNLDPRQVVRWENGQRISQGNVIPTPYTKERAHEILTLSQQSAKYGPWSDQMKHHMTDGEIAYTHVIWDRLDGSSSFCSAFGQIKQGAVEACQRAYQEIE